MIEISELMTDPDFAQPFVIRRVSGAFAGEGEFTRTETTVNASGVIQPASEDDLKMLPEGERSDSAIKVYSKTELRRGDGAGTESDVIEWLGKRYRVMQSKPWQLHGYYFAIATGP